MANIVDEIKNTYTTLEGSRGEYVPHECPQCAEHAELHYRLICRVCEWPPALDGKCVCDWEKHEKANGR
jgi:hypothetical protein